MPFEPSQLTDISLATLARLAMAGKWQLSLAHDRDHHLLIWITKGQGTALLDGARHGIGVHSALFIPAHHLMAVDPGRQGFGLALMIPADSELSLPERSVHLRIRNLAAQAELTRLMGAIGQEQNERRPLYQGAMQANCELVAIWLHRQTDRQIQEAGFPAHDSAARALSRAWCARLVSDFTRPDTMAGHAAALGVSATHLARVCRAETGKTAAGLLSERKLHAARRLLIETNVPVLDISRHLGFGSAAYFTRFIKAQTGAPPTFLRRNARNRV